MIKVTLKEVESSATSGGKFHNKSDIKIDTHTCGTPEERAGQRYYMGRIRSKIEALEELPCDASVTADCSEGKVHIEGEIAAATPLIKELIQGIVANVTDMATSFAKQNPHSSFKLAYTLITSVIEH